MLKKHKNVVYFLECTKNVIYVFIFIVNWIFLSGSRDIIWAKEFIRICQCFFLILSATFVVSDNNSYSKYSLKSFFSSVILRKWVILNMPLEHRCKLKIVVAFLKFEHLKTQQLVVFKYSVFFTLYFSFLILFSLSKPNTFFTHFCIYVYILESHYFRKCIGASQLKKSSVSLKARHA